MPPGQTPVPGPAPPQRGRLRRALSHTHLVQLAAALIVAGAAVFLGIAILADDGDPAPAPLPISPAADSVPSVGAQPDNSRAAPEDSAPQSSTAPPDDAAPPSGGSSSAQDPVVAVAETVIPSVVLISTANQQGSGIVWDAEEGYIVTNQHVVREITGETVETVLVTFSHGVQVEGEVLGGSSSHDVAVVRVDPAEADLAAAEFAPVSSVRVGQLAVAVGSPFGLTETVTAGIVSGVRIIGGTGGSALPVPIKVIQTDAPINRGNSGGPLADRDGRVIGMNTLIQTAGFDGNVGVGFAVPSDTIELMARRIVDGDSLESGFLGISAESGIVDPDGVVVSEVVDGSAAAAAGIRVGDVLSAIDGEPMSDIAELAAAVKLRKPGDEVQVTVLRGDETLALRVELGRLNEPVS